MSLPIHLLSDLANNHISHAKSTVWYETTAAALDRAITEVHGPTRPDKMDLAEVGQIVFPYFSMGNIDSVKLFGLDELIIFSFYYANRGKYNKVLDLGANIGLHTLILRLMGFQVESYEPDPHHVEQIKKVLSLNQQEIIGIHEVAVSFEEGELDFLRILGNTTGSHLAGSKPGEPYGPVERFKVRTVAINSIMAQGFDLVKMDVEGHEAQLIESLDPVYLKTADIMLEVGSSQNAERIFKIMKRSGIPMYAQRLNWAPISDVAEMPISHRDGSLFISHKRDVPWGG